jgi:8-oxo-dGTP diphosphatase
MRIIKTLTDKDFGMDVPAPEKYTEMRSTRVIIFDKNMNVLVLHSKGLNYHTIPGGGIKDDENIEDAAKREIMEEVGCKMKNIRELGIIEEYRNIEKPRHQYTYYFLADLDGEIGEPHFEDDELIDDFETITVTADKFLDILYQEKSGPLNYNAKFFVARHIAAVEEAMKII